MPPKRKLTPEHRAAISAGLRGRATSDVHRARIAASKRGKPRDAETRAKISASLSGRTDSPEARAKKVASARRAKDSATWVGTAVSYNGAHNRARLVLPLECALADDTCRGRLEVALRDAAPTALVRVSPRGHRYYAGEDVNAGYHRLCASHHRRYDSIAW